MSECVFCAIVDRRIEASIVWEDRAVVAFLDRSPVFKGHVLVVPRAHVETLPALPGDDVAPFFSAVQRVAAVLPDALDAHGTFVAINNVVSQSVPHLHAHVVPRWEGDHNFMPVTADTHVLPQALEELWEKLAAAFPPA